MDTMTAIRFRRFSPAALATARRRRGLTQQVTADRIGRLLRQYQRIEYGDIRPTADMLGALAAALDVTIDSLYAMPEEGVAP